MKPECAPKGGQRFGACRHESHRGYLRRHPWPPVRQRCVIEARPQPGCPRSGCAAGPSAPRGSHGAWRPTGTAMGARRTRLHHGSGSPPKRSASACPGSAARGVRLWPNARLTGAISAARRARPAARTLRSATLSTWRQRRLSPRTPSSFSSRARSRRTRQ